MATRRRIGVSIATSEAARRQLMQPVVCWEKAWVTPEHAAPNSSMKVFKWIQTEKKQQFSDDEGEMDEPLAPLPDEPEVVEGDEEIMDQDEVAPSVAPETASAVDITEPNSVVPDIPEASTKPPSPQPPALSLSTQEDPAMTAGDAETVDVLEPSLAPLGEATDAAVGLDEKTEPEGAESLDLTALGPDGTSFEGVHDLSQLEPTDALMGGPMMDDSMD
ncbi:hypothetical protein SERLADRAFT_472376, partial [Serpula lacrymans var. lacrymans S7.9]